MWLGDLPPALLPNIVAAEQDKVVTATFPLSHLLPAGWGCSAWRKRRQWQGSKWLALKPAPDFEKRGFVCICTSAHTGQRGW